MGEVSFRMFSDARHHLDQSFKALFESWADLSNIESHGNTRLKEQNPKAFEG